MQNQLQKVINIVKKTGDRLIVFDPQKVDDVYVVMPLDEYEKLAIGKSEVRGLTEDELLDKINRDIAIWKSEQDFAETQKMEEENFFDEAGYNRENFDYFHQRNKRNTGFPTPVGEVLEKRNLKKKSMNNSWAIPMERKEGAEEIIEEDRQYLEEI